eukprot:Clim_evm87s243 gene=Clim_evmTU87s243
MTSKPNIGTDFLVLRARNEDFEERVNKVKINGLSDKKADRFRKSPHHFYVRLNSSKSDLGLPEGKTIFVTNIPFYMSESDLKKTFEAAAEGTVEYLVCRNLTYDSGVVTLSKNLRHRQHQLKKEINNSAPQTPAMRQLTVTGEVGPPAEITLTELMPQCRVAYVSFSRKTYAQAILALCQAKSTIPLICDSSEYQSTSLGGLAAFRERYLGAIVSHTELESFASEVIFTAEDAEAEERRRLLESAGVPDKDGWVTVVHKRATNLSGGAGSGAVPVHKAVKKRQKRYEMDNFYRFQKTNQKQERLSKLRKAFEEDRAKLKQLQHRKKRKAEPETLD